MSSAPSRAASRAAVVTAMRSAGNPRVARDHRLRAEFARDQHRDRAAVDEQRRRLAEHDSGRARVRVRADHHEVVQLGRGEQRVGQPRSVEVERGCLNTACRACSTACSAASRACSSEAMARSREAGVRGGGEPIRPSAPASAIACAIAAAEMSPPSTAHTMRGNGGADGCCRRRVRERGSSMSCSVPARPPGRVGSNPCNGRGGLRSCIPHVRRFTLARFEQLRHLHDQRHPRVGAPARIGERRPAQLGQRRRPELLGDAGVAQGAWDADRRQQLVHAREGRRSRRAAASPRPPSRAPAPSARTSRVRRRRRSPGPA